MSIIDLTMPLDNMTPVFPGDQRPEITPVAAGRQHGWSERKLVLSTHSGTHVDAPSHMIADGKTLSDLPGAAAD